MRKRLEQHLHKSLSARLRERFPDSRGLDPAAEDFNGMFGFAIRANQAVWVFLVLTPHGERDTFRASIAWGVGEHYPASPLRDLALDPQTLLDSPSAELALADASGGRLPHEYGLDPAASAAEAARDAIQQRIARGEDVEPAEWLATLVGDVGPLNRSLELAGEASAAVVDALCHALRRIRVCAAPG